jgi:Taurine catabolism dioxygenase TauD, TfdA family
MTRPNKLPICTPSPHVLNELALLATTYAVCGWDFKDWEYETSTDLTLCASYLNLYDFVQILKRTLTLHGFVIIELAALINLYSPATAASATTLLLSSFGSPLRIFENIPYWRRIEVDLNRPPERSGGAGKSPLHMDFVNAENPPDIVCLLCLRPDPSGGGASLVSEISGIEDLLSTSDICSLMSSRFNDGKVDKLRGVGKDFNPFPVIAPDSFWKYRFTGNLIHAAPDSQALAALQKASNILDSRAVNFVLEQGELLVMNQHRVVHGRGALGKGQENISTNKRRLLPGCLTEVGKSQ